MTHLSDFSYLERCTIWVYISVYLFYSIYIGDRFKCLRFKTIASGELKSIVTIIMIIMIMMQFMWDIASTYVKYQEGFVAVSETHIVSKPFEMWTSKHQTLMMAMDYVECITFSLQTGALFLMQSFWNYLSNTYARKSFMGSLEFKFYILWALGSMAMFPVLQWVYRDDVSKREGIPQLAYGAEAMLAAILGVRSHFRFRRIIALSEKNNGASNKSIVNRLTYFKDMNMMITVVLFSYAASMIIICSDGLTEKLVINSNKFAIDTIIANVNICTVFILLLLISIFHPRPQYTREGDTSANTESKYSKTTNGRVNNYIQNENTRQTNEKETKYIGSAITSNANTNNNNGGFMRAMSPVTVDYPHSLTNDTEPLTNNTRSNPRTMSPSEKMYTNNNNTRNLTIEDPYSSQQVMFSMMDMQQQQQQQQQRYGLPNSPTSMNSREIPMRGMTTRSTSPRYMEDDHYTDMSSAYEHTTSPTRIGHPSWERPTPPNNQYSAHPTVNQYSTDQQGDEIVRDWLWQSPDRRN